MNADAIVILTEWQLFYELRWFEISKKMRKPSWVFDTRGIINVEELKKLGINVWKIGFSNEN